MKKLIGTAGAAGILAIALGAGGSFAAEPPSLVGVWKADPATYAAIRVGEENDHHPEYADPTFGSPESAWTIEVKEQKGRAFHGVATSPKGMSEAFVGVVSFDGEHFIASASEGGITGEVLADGKIDFCYADQEDDRSQVSCFVMAKQ